MPTTSPYWALAEVQKVGVEVIIWPEESVKLAAQKQMEWAEKYLDVPENAELFGIIQRFAKMKGYI